ncbi:hypothetical protein LB503_006874 [Fusarium chuoi]|nr:hypothetical protein LB503_006874 [Fusarium chuoi]
MADTAEASGADHQQEPAKRNRVVDSVGEKAQEVFKEDYAQAREHVASAAKSRSYLYPIKPFISKLGPLVLLSTGVIGGMFFFTYLPQLAVLFFVNGPIAPFSAVLLVLNESTTIINLVSRNYLLQDALLDVFDDTQIVSEGREVKSGADPMQKLGKIIKSPFEKFSPKAIVRYVMYLPLNAIPVVGTAIFILIQVGAALWAADIEDKNASMTDGTAPTLRETAKKAE